MIVFAKTITVLDWWRTFSREQQGYLVEKYFDNKNFLLLSDINIEEIYETKKRKSKKKK